MFRRKPGHCILAATQVITADTLLWSRETDLITLCVDDSRGMIGSLQVVVEDSPHTGAAFIHFVFGVRTFYCISTEQIVNPVPSRRFFLYQAGCQQARNGRVYRTFTLACHRYQRSERHLRARMQADDTEQLSRVSVKVMI
jgi:hypothetical protein